MAKPDTSRIDTLEAIMADKRKHESYLAKLEERRAATPAHVFNRLRDEYLTKLTDLQVRATMEAESLSEGLKADEAAVAEIEARLAVVTEERIEGELRAEVGEYDPKEWGKKLEALNATIAQIEKERATKVAAFERTRSLLIEARGAATPADVPAAAVVPEPAALPVAASPAPAPAHIVEASSAPRVSAPTPSKADVPARRTPLGQPVPEAPAATAASAPMTEPSSAPVPRSSTPSPTAPPAPPTPADRPKTPGQAAPLAGSPSFDELAFLNSVVGRTSISASAADVVESASAEPGSSGATTAKPAPVAPTAPASRTTSNVRPPLAEEAGPLGRPTPRTSQAIKTLKCQECGTLNFPTEWYCERCGGELAAL